MIDTQKLTAYLTDYRRRLEQAWIEETASPNLRPIAGKPMSTGQCSATSLMLFDDLHADLDKDLLIKIAIGQVIDLARHAQAIELHVWLQLYDEKYAVPVIADLTADQSMLIDKKLILEKNVTLVETEQLLYLPYNLYAAPTEIKEGTQARAALLRERMAVIK